MRKHLLAAASLAACAFPHLPRRDGPYVGIEGGVTFPRAPTSTSSSTTPSATPVTTTTYSNGYNLNYKTG